jgi:hypothetical protein
MFAFLTGLLLVAQSDWSHGREGENIVLRQQLIVLSRKAPPPVRLRNIDLRLAVPIFLRSFV